MNHREESYGGHSKDDYHIYKILHSRWATGGGSTGVNMNWHIFKSMISSMYIYYICTEGLVDAMMIPLVEDTPFHCSTTIENYATIRVRWGIIMHEQTVEWTDIQTDR